MSESMSSVARISAREWSLREVLGGHKYGVDYYQREYKWESKQIQEMMDDLSSRFLRSYRSEHRREEVGGYGPYFLGSIVVSERQGEQFIVDGQQRLTTLTLLLLFLYRHDGLSEDERSGLRPLIFSARFGKKSYNLDVEERGPLLDALFEGRSFDPQGKSEAVVNMAERFEDIADAFPDDLSGEALPFFVDWLVERVFLVKIVATDDEDAYTIFETMNDRGLPLNPVDMLKGFLLANIKDADRRNRCNKIWRDRIQSIASLYRDAEHDFIKAWLRGQYGRTIRATMANSEPGDYDKIGSEFHRWVRDETSYLGLHQSEDYARWIEEDFDFFARAFIRLHEASHRLTPGLETLYYNQQAGLTLQPMALLASIRKSDPPERVALKWRVCGKALDIVLARRTWGQQSIAQRMMKFPIFELTKKIRRQQLDELARTLHEYVGDSPEAFGPGFVLNSQNRRAIHRILARLTDFVEFGSGYASKYVEYTGGGGPRAYEVEHIWADKPERHQDEFAPADFRAYRHRIGGLLLLPKRFNASYGALPYDEKLPHYDAQNLLVRSLHSHAYDHNPGFRSFIERTGLPFKPHPQFKRNDLDERAELMQMLARQVWNPDDILREVQPTPQE